MTDVKATIKRVFAKPLAYDGKRPVLSAAFAIALSLALIFIAFFAPFRYNSNRSGLHYVTVEGNSVIVHQSAHVDQSMFKLLEASSYIGAAMALNAFTYGSETDGKAFDKAMTTLRELRAQYDVRYARAVKQAAEAGADVDSEKFACILSDNLSDMNMIALDMLEAAYRSDNREVFSAISTGCVLGMLSALVNIMVIVTALVCIVFATIAIVAKQRFKYSAVFFNILGALSVCSMLMCVYNCILPPSSAPLALACTALISYFVYGTAKTLVSDSSLRVSVLGTLASACAIVGLLGFAVMPSFAIKLSGIGNKYADYPGTFGTAYLTWASISVNLGVKISRVPIIVGGILGGNAMCFTVLSAFATLGRNAKSKQTRSKFGFCGAMLSLLFCIITAAVVAGMDSVNVIYGVKSGVFISLAFMAATAITLIVSAAVNRSNGDANVSDAPVEADDAETPGAERSDLTEDTVSSINSDTTDASARADSAQ